MFDHRHLAALVLTALACDRADPPIATRAAPLVAYCEAEDLPPPVVLEWMTDVFGDQVDASGDRAVISFRVASFHSTVQAYHRDAAGWQHDGVLTLSMPYCTVFPPSNFVPCAADVRVAIQGDLAVVGYVSAVGLKASPAYGAVVELLRATPAGYVGIDVDILEVNESDPHWNLPDWPQVDVAIDGDDVVAGVSWPEVSSSSSTYGYAVAYRIADDNGQPSLTDRQLLWAPSPGPYHGDRVAVRHGLVAVANPDPSGSPTVAFFRRDAGGTFGVDAVATPPASPPPDHLHVAIVDDDHAIIAVEAGAAQTPPITLYQRAAGAPVDTFAPLVDLPVAPANTGPHVQSIDAHGDRVVLAGHQVAPSLAPWVEVYRWHAGNQAFTTELSWVGTSVTAIGGVAALADDFLIAGSAAVGGDGAFEAWPFAELGAVDDGYALDPPAPLIVPAAAGVMSNDELHCSAPAAALDLAPAHGTVALTADGGFVYTPGEVPIVACGDKFTYRLGAGAETSGAATVDLDFRNPLCRRFSWAAFDRAPYLYTGCPDPGPEPWRDIPAIVARGGDALVDVELASAVALDVAVVTAPSNGTITTSSHGFAFVPAAGAEPSTSRVALRVTHDACTYLLAADLTVAP